MKTRKCLNCSKTIYKKQTTSLKDWNTQTKFCSIKCYWAHSVGSKHPKWKGGQFKTKKGYVYILVHGHPKANKFGYIPKANYIMEKHLGRYLKPSEVIHHINHKRDDNRIKNLKLFKDKSEHQRHHSENHFKKGHKPNKR